MMMRSNALAPLREDSARLEQAEHVDAGGRLNRLEPLVVEREGDDRTHRVVVIGDEDSTLHHASLVGDGGSGIGSSTLNRVPPCGRLATSRNPPWSWTMP